MRTSGIGGMAVIEGVMMKNKRDYAIAVRKPNKEIEVEKRTYKDFSDKVKLFKLPIFRGMLAFVDSLVIGMKVLNYSASFFDEEDQASVNKKDNKTSNIDKKNIKGKTTRDEEKDFKVEEVSITDKKTGEAGKTQGTNAFMTAAAVLVSLMISIAFFMVLPVLVSNLFSKIIKNNFWIYVLEGVLRLAIFIGYILIVSQMNDIKRVFMYHGAEHKTINCIENGFELTVDNVRWQSKQNRRCGTSFMLFVMLISLIVFVLLQPKTLLWRILSRILLIPVISGISFEVLMWTGKTNNPIIMILSKPGLWLQGLTTKEPDDSMIEVAIQSVDAVFDWRGFLEAAPAAEKNKALKKNRVEVKSESSINHKNTEQTKKAAPSQAGREQIRHNAEQTKKSMAQNNSVEQIKKSPAQNNNAEQLKKSPTQNNNAEQLKKSPAQNNSVEQIKKSPAQINNVKSVNNSNQSNKVNSTISKKNMDYGKNIAAAKEIDKAAGIRKSEEDDDEILKALDKYLDCGDNKDAK